VVIIEWIEELVEGMASFSVTLGTFFKRINSMNEQLGPFSMSVGMPRQQDPSVLLN
jgi:hypothetical protein